MVNITHSPNSETSICVGKLKAVNKVYLVLSGKGGVGKSFVSFALAKHLSQVRKKSVCLLDVDLNGPTISYLCKQMMNPLLIETTELQTHKDKISPSEIYPVKIQDNFFVISVGNMVDKNQSITLKGPAKTRLIENFLEACCLQDFDYLIIDTPPGTSDEHIAIVEQLKFFNPDGAILVTAPHLLSMQDVQRELNFCMQAGISITGIVDNMSYFVCPGCSERTELMRNYGGGQAIAEKYKLQYLGSLPIVPPLNSASEGAKCKKNQSDLLSHNNESHTNVKLAAYVILDDQLESICSHIEKEYRSVASSIN